MTNRIFNVNGPLDRPELLKTAIDLAMRQGSAARSPAVVGYTTDPDIGLVFFYISQPANTPGYHPLPAAMEAEVVAGIVRKWLESPYAEVMNPSRCEWDNPYSGEDEVVEKPGWRIYVEDAGRVDGRDDVAFAVRPVDVWRTA